MNALRLGLLAATVVPALLAGFCFAQKPDTASSDWKAIVQNRLLLYGHRNWIAVTDSAFPAYADPRIETIVVHEDLAPVLRYVAGAIASSHHVRATVFVDQELPFVDEHDFPGVSELRKQIAATFAKDQISSLPHNEIISKLDEAGKTFKILFIKTAGTTPYTSVFMRLDCGYLTDEGERKIRAAISAAGSHQPK